MFHHWNSTCPTSREKLTTLEVLLIVWPMRTHDRHYMQTLWVALTLIIPFVYLLQIAPHVHDAHPEPISHHDSNSPNHSHPHDSSDSERPDSAHHHHELTNHLDTHVVLLQFTSSSSDSEGSIGTVTADLGIIDRKSQFSTPDKFEPPPPSPLIVASAPRAPPLQG
jgi:hypothetical protein